MHIYTRVHLICSFRKALDVIIGRAPDPSLMATTNEIENRIYNQTLDIFHTIPWMDEQTRYILKFNSQIIKLILI